MYKCPLCGKMPKEHKDCPMTWFKGRGHYEDETDTGFDYDAGRQTSFTTREWVWDAEPAWIDYTSEFKWKEVFVG